jgi:NADH dehydrogenase
MEQTAEKILIVGGGYAGFYTAWNLEKKLRRGEADVTLVDPHGYMTYQPFLPEVTAGSIEARHVMVSLRRHLRRTTVVAGHTTSIDHAHRTATVRTNDGALRQIGYDTIVVTGGAVTRTFPVPGIEREAIGLKHVEEAVAIRDQLLTAFDRAALLPPGVERRRLLTVTVVGGGFTGVEVFGELLSLATSLLRVYPELGRDDLSFHLVDANDRILSRGSRPGSCTAAITSWPCRPGNVRSGCSWSGCPRCCSGGTSSRSPRCSSRVRRSSRAATRSRGPTPHDPTPRSPS